MNAPLHHQPIPVELPEQEIKKMWHIFPTDSTSTIGLRAIWPSGTKQSGPTIDRLFSAEQYPDIGERQAAFEKETLRLNRLGYNVYVVMNPIRADFDGKAANDASIQQRWVLLLDVDRAGPTKQPANDAEVDAGGLLADQLEGWLAERGWGKSHRVMSGNGHHLYYLLADLPNDEHSKNLVQTLLRCLAVRFDNETVKIDKSVSNASRITKVPGTIARKGLESEGRPYRMATVLSVAAGPTGVTSEMLERLCAELAGPVKGAVKRSPKASRPQPALHDLGPIPVWAESAAGDGVVWNLVNKPPPETPYEIAKLKSALQQLSPSVPRGEGPLFYGDGSPRTDYWVGVIWAIASLGWDSGKDIAREWSQGCPDRYKEDGFEKDWNGFNPNHPNPIGIGSLYKLVRDLGDGGLNAASRAPNSHGDIRNGRAFASHWRGRLLYVTTRERWLIWRDERWQLCDRGEEMECAKAVSAALLKTAAEVYAADQSRGSQLIREAKAAHNLPKLKAMLTLATSEPGMSAGEGDLDADPMLLGVQNGVVDLRTGRLLPNKPELLITRFCAANFDPLAQCPRWLEFLNQVFEGDTETIESVQRLIGYTLTGLVTEEVLVICYGYGSNGKSVFSNVVHRISDGYSRTAPSSMLAARRADDNGPRNDLAAIAGARYVSINEFQAGDQLDEQTVKLLAGREPIAARFLYQELFEYTPTFTAWMRTNHKPIVKGEDDGIWRRLVLLPFRRKFTDEEKDPGLEDKLMAERDGILRWCVEGTSKYLKDGLKLSPLIRREHSSYRTESDLLGEFLNEITERDPQTRIEQSRLFLAWRSWCDANGLRCSSKKSFTQRLCERGISSGKSNGQAFYVGLTLSEQGEKGRILMVLG
jgi:putative DNA primase/helicase